MYLIWKLWRWASIPRIEHDVIMFENRQVWILLLSCYTYDCDLLERQH